MQSANQRRDERYSPKSATSSEMNELFDIGERLTQIDEERTLLRVKRKRLLDRIAKRARG